MQAKKEHSKEKTELHLRNKHRKRYVFNLLIQACSELKQYVTLNDYGDESIDFFNPSAVKALNKALLKTYYKINYWDIPDNYLCPPIPGRADYIHYMADLLATNYNGKIPLDKQIKCLDIGVGANCVYPIIGNIEYGWTFVGSDIDSVAINAANKIVEMNTVLKGQIELRLQPNKKDIFKGIIKEDEQFDLVICNPPFHSSLAEAQSGSLRKLSNLKNKKITNATLNFGGSNNELWCEGGESNFIKIMIEQSILYKKSCLWFSCLISKQANLDKALIEIKKAGAHDLKIINMRQGNKISRVVAWTFQTQAEQLTRR